MTPAQGRAQRKQLMREIARDERKKQREHLAGLKQAIREAHRGRRTALVETKASCRAARREVRERVKRMRAEALAELRAAVALEKANARSTCAAGKQLAKDLGSKHARARHELETERAYRAEMRRIEHGNKARARDILHPRGARARELKSESDDTVRGNIPPELVALFERVKAKIKGTDRMSRTEAFLEYAESHDREVLEAIEDRTDAMLRELEAKERAAHKALKRPLARARAGAAALDEAVPF